MTGSLIAGSAETGLIVWAPPPPMLKAIVSVPGFALASRIACLSEPAPLSCVLVTVNVCAVGVNMMARRTRIVDNVKNAKRHRQRLRLVRESRKGEGRIMFRSSGMVNLSFRAIWSSRLFSTSLVRQLYFRPPFLTRVKCVISFQYPGRPINGWAVFALDF